MMSLAPTRIAMLETFCQSAILDARTERIEWFWTRIFLVPVCGEALWFDMNPWIVRILRTALPDPRPSRSNPRRNTGQITLFVGASF